MSPHQKSSWVEQDTTDELYANISTGRYDIPQELPVGLHPPDRLQHAWVRQVEGCKAMGDTKKIG